MRRLICILLFAALAVHAWAQDGGSGGSEEPKAGKEEGGKEGAGKEGAEVTWRKVEAGEDGVVDLEAACGTVDYAVACAVAYVYSPQGGPVRMASTSDDSIMIRVNGKEALRNHALRAAFMSVDKFDCQLQPGWNELLVKVAECDGAWKFVVFVENPGGVLKFSAHPQPAEEPVDDTTEPE